MAFQQVRVKSDWSDPANAWRDIKQATALQEPFSHQTMGEGVLQISLWEGKFDPDDYANLMIVGHTQRAYRIFGADQESCSWESAPIEGTVSIIGISYRHTVVF